MGLGARLGPPSPIAIASASARLGRTLATCRRARGLDSFAVLPKDLRTLLDETGLLAGSARLRPEETIALAELQARVGATKFPPARSARLRPWWRH